VQISPNTHVKLKKNLNTFEVKKKKKTNTNIYTLKLNGEYLPLFIIT
jgi:hypothetical protein